MSRLARSVVLPTGKWDKVLGLVSLSMSRLASSLVLPTGKWDNPCPVQRSIGLVVDRYLMLYTQSTAKGHIRATQTVLLSQGLFYLLKAYSPVNRTESPQGFFTSSNSIQVEYNTNMHKRKTYKQNPKVSPFGIALVKKKKEIKL